MSKDPQLSVESADNSGSISRVESPKKTWRRYVWDTLDKSPEERRFLFKLDAGVLTICCLGYFTKYLDQANLTNAYVSGMKEELNMYGNQLVYVQTLYTVGYIIGQVPSNILLTRVRPSVWLPSCEIIWSILTMCLSRVNNVKQLYALRFLVGLAESGYYPGILYMLGSWYRKDELGKRACIFNMSSAIATMFSGYLMTAVINLDGKGGFKGWQWLYIMDGVISLPIALAGFFMLPDDPSNSRAWYITEKDKETARARMRQEKRQLRQPYTRAKVIKILTTWHIYLLPLLFFFAGGAGAAGQPVFSLYLKQSKHPKYTLQQINDYPTAASGVQIFCTLLYSWISDTLLNGRRWPIIVAASTINGFLYICLAVWNIPNGLLWFCFIMLAQGIVVSPMSLVWGNEICSGDNEERAIVVGAMNDFGYVMGAWLPLIIWKTVEAPRYHKGFITGICSTAVAILLTLLINTLWKRDLARQSSVPEAVEVASQEDRVLSNEQEKSVY